MKIKFSPVNAGIIIALILFVIVVTWLVMPSQPPTALGERFICAGQFVPFRANATPCALVHVAPHENEVVGLIMNPRASYTILLMDPAETAAYGSSVYEVQKTLTSLQIPHILAFTEEWPKQPQIPVMTIENATKSTPIIWFRSGQENTMISVSNTSITISAKDQAGLDAASCKVAMTLLDSLYNCWIEE